MKELKNRIKGLSAMLLAMSLALCLVMRFSEVRVSAKVYDSINLILPSDAEIPNNIKDGNDIYKNTVNAAIENKIITKKVLSASSIALKTNCDENITYEETPAINAYASGYYGSATLNDESGYDGFIITDYIPETKMSVLPNGGYTTCTCYSLTIQLVNDPAKGVHAGHYYMTTGTKYSFSNTSSDADSDTGYKVQGDPTVYLTTDFYVPSNEFYTIEQ